MLATRLSPINYKLITRLFKRIFGPPPHTKALQTYASTSTMSRERKRSLARGHGKIGGSKDIMDVSIKPNMEAEIAYVCNLKKLLNLKLKATNVDVLALNEKKTIAQADLIAAQSKVIVAKCMLEKKNCKFKS